jgi:TatD DNase family protein
MSRGNNEEGTGFFIDSHCHLAPFWFSHKPVETALKDAKEANVIAVINSAVGVQDEEKGLIDYDYSAELSQKNLGYVFCTLGLSPSMIKILDVDYCLKRIEELVEEKHVGVVGIGEIGIDRHWVLEDSWQKRQLEVFKLLISIGGAAGLPLVIHSRKAESLALDVLEKNADTDVVLHCFSGSVELGKRAVDDGYFVSIPTAVVNRKKHKKLAKALPLENLVVETDAPWLSPVEKEKNEPAFVRYAVEEIAKINEYEVKEVSKVTTKNAIRIFSLPL